MAPLPGDRQAQYRPRPAPLGRRGRGLLQVLFDPGETLGKAQARQAELQALQVQAEVKRLAGAQQQCFKQAVTELQPPVGQRQGRCGRPVQPYSACPGHRQGNQSGRVNNSEPLVPPKPKELESAYSIVLSWAVLGT